MAKIGTVVLDIKADTAKLVDGMQRAERAVTKTVSRIKNTIIGLAAAYASIQSVRAFGGMVQDAIDYADNLGKLAQKLGMTAEELSKLQYAASYADVSLGKLDAALSALVRRSTNFVRTGGGAAAKAFKELGISVAYARKHFTSTDAIFRIVMERLSKMPDGYRKTAIAQDLFSKSAADMLRVASMGSEEFARLSQEAQKIGVYVPNSIAQMAASYNDAITHISQNILGIKRTIAYGMVKPLYAFVKTMDEHLVKSFGRGRKAVSNFGDIAKDVILKMIKGFGFVKDVMTGIKIVIKGIELGFLYLAKGIRFLIDKVKILMNRLISMQNKFADSYLGQKLGIRKIR